jgi:hypothetical protein
MNVYAFGLWGLDLSHIDSQIKTEKQEKSGFNCKKEE